MGSFLVFAFFPKNKRIVAQSHTHRKTTKTSLMAEYAQLLFAGIVQIDGIALACRGNPPKVVELV